MSTSYSVVNYGSSVNAVSATAVGSAITSAVTPIAASVTAENNRAVSSEAAIVTTLTTAQSDLAAEVTRATAKEATLTSGIVSANAAIAAEVSRATASESTLNTALTTAQAAITAAQTSINSVATGAGATAVLTGFTSTTGAITASDTILSAIEKLNGNVASAVGGNVTSATTAGTVTTAAQPNITSLGTLTGLSVTAPINGSITGNAGTVTNGVYTNTVNSLAIGAPVTGFTSAAGTITAADSVLSAIQKLNGNVVAEITARITGDTTLTNNLATAQTAATTASTNASSALALANTASGALTTTLDVVTALPYTVDTIDITYSGNPGNTVLVNVATAGVVTIPNDTTSNTPVGSTINVAQIGVGKVTFAGGAGVTINSSGGLLSLATQYAAATLLKTAANTCLLIGDIAA